MARDHLRLRVPFGVEAVERVEDQIGGVPRRPGPGTTGSRTLRSATPVYRSVFGLSDCPIRGASPLAIVAAAAVFSKSRRRMIAI
jgi:hypothetical protein